MNKIKKELIRFIIAGIAAVGIDLLAYYIFLFFLSVNISKGASFITGSIFAYLINKFWTFQQKNKSYKELFNFAILYSISFGFNIAVNQFALKKTGIILLSFVLATGFSASLNFIGQKFWVFNHNKK